MAVPEPCRQCGRLAFPGEAVTISGDDYRELLQFRQAREATAVRLSAVRADKRTRIARDPELAAFIAQSAETMIPAEIETAAVARFGRERVPSRWTIHRFLFGGRRR